MEKAELPTVDKFIVPVTIMLSFVSFWRAAAIVLSDLGSSAYYVGGIAEKAIGKTAPWFILAIMLFSYVVRAVYIESCSMFVRGGVYRVVREAMGSVAAKFSVSALMFDYVLTGPISAVSAGQYFAGLINESGKYFSLSWLQVSAPLFATGFGVLVTLYFWHTNRVGIPFSSGRALRIMQITTVMVVILILWCLITIFTQGYQPVPIPMLVNLKFSDEALGWLKGTIAPNITIVALLIGLGHSLLAMSGEESLAQVNREIEAPKHQNLIRAGLVIFVYSLVFTSLVSFFAVMIIPDAQRSRYFDNLISGLSIFLVGPFALKLAFHAFVVLVGTLILSGAVNTAIIGSNGVLNRVAEDGVLPDWFRAPHQKYGTTYRIINLIVILQIMTIFISGGDVYMLGEAYAFGVVWSFAMKSLAVVVLRFKEPDVQRWKVPLNFHVRGVELPIGLILIMVTLFLLAGINMMTKTIATISGGIFTLVFFTGFTLSERYYHAGGRRTGLGSKMEEGETERFRLEVRENLSPQSLQVRPGNILVAVHDPNSLGHLQTVLEEINPQNVDVVALSVNINAPNGGRDLAKQAEQVFDNYETLVFSRVVHAAEKAGKPVSLLAVAGKEPYNLILQAAQKLHSWRVVIGRSSTVNPIKQEQEIAQAWEHLPPPQPTLNVEIVPDRDRVPPIELRFGV
jgi:amino acid transporter